MRESHYAVILADPPWAFKTYTGKHATPHRRIAGEHYAVMQHDALADIPVASWAAKDCALFMWVVDSHLDAGIALASAWGFQFKTIAFVWDKGRIGMGYWTRKQAEVCLLFTRGKPKRVDKGVRQVITAPRREHSRKPDEQYERIERLVAGPYLEMFARTRRLGWDQFGDQLDTFPDDSIRCDSELAVSKKKKSQSSRRKIIALLNAAGELPLFPEGKK